MLESSLRVLEIALLSELNRERAADLRFYDILSEISIELHHPETIKSLALSSLSLTLFNESLIEEMLHNSKFANFVILGLQMENQVNRYYRALLRMLTLLFEGRSGEAIISKNHQIGTYLLRLVKTSKNDVELLRYNLRVYNYVI